MSLKPSERQDAKFYDRFSPMSFVRRPAELHVSERAVGNIIEVWLKYHATGYANDNEQRSLILGESLIPVNAHNCDHALKCYD